MNARHQADSGLQVADLSLRRAGQPLFEALDLSVPQGSTLAVLGASGCGKTSLLRVLAGLDTAAGGSIHLDGRDIGSLPPQQRQTLYLYQEALLFPHLNVLENIAFGLRLRKRPDCEIRAACEALLRELELEGLGRRAPEQLSGGQRQRVAFGRALAVQPRLLLLDEPFGSLDAQTRGSMQTLFRRVAAEHRITAVFVTHDVQEALRIGDRFGLMHEGRLRCFHSRADFCADPASGIDRERAFWRELDRESMAPTTIAVECTEKGPC